MNFCTNCGIQNLNETKFCTSCGKALSVAEIREPSLDQSFEIDPATQGAPDSSAIKAAPVNTPQMNISKASEPFIGELEMEKLIIDVTSNPKRKVGITKILAFVAMLFILFIAAFYFWNRSQPSGGSTSVEILNRLNSTLPAGSSDKWELDVANQLTGVPAIDVYLCGTGSAAWIYDSLATAQSSMAQGDWIDSKDNLYVGPDSETPYGIIFATNGLDPDCLSSAAKTFNPNQS